MGVADEDRPIVVVSVFGRLMGFGVVGPRLGEQMGNVGLALGRATLGSIR